VLLYRLSIIRGNKNILKQKHIALMQIILKLYKAISQIAAFILLKNREFFEFIEQYILRVDTPCIRYERSFYTVLEFMV